MLLCVTVKQQVFFKQPQTMSGGPDSLKTDKNGKTLLKIGKKGLVLLDR